ncbi:MAG: hypothetical protein E6J90_28540 [Deltaproteobacteria bacterium]|nr:MAG: hypothetical protein E6J90_28540 [Deltaproteobacteria bacterium]
MADRSLLQVSLQGDLAAGGVVHVVERQDRGVEQRVGPRGAAPWRFSDHAVPCLLGLREVLEPALGDAERDAGGVVIGSLFDNRGELGLGARVVAGIQQHGRLVEPGVDVGRVE